MNILKSYLERLKNISLNYSYFILIFNVDDIVKYKKLLYDTLIYHFNFHYK